MKKIFIFASCLFVFGSLHAENKRTIVDIDRELKQSKSTGATVALLESLSETTPRTVDDVSALGRLLDNYPAQGQKALSRINDPKLAGAVQVECVRQIEAVVAYKSKSLETLSYPQRVKRQSVLQNLSALMNTLGGLKNKDSVPFLKKYLTAEYDGEVSYSASKAIGMIMPDDPMVFQELWSNSSVKNISYSAYGKSVLREAAEKIQVPNISKKEKEKILAKAKLALLGGRSGEEKELVKSILLTHPDAALREEVSVAMVHAVINNPEQSDKEFVIQWAKKENSLALYEAVNVMDLLWDSKFLPVLFDMLSNQSYWVPRSKIAGLLGRRQIQESLPYLEKCILHDSDSVVRGECQVAYYKITGVVPPLFNPIDAKAFEEDLATSYTNEYYRNRPDSDPDKKYHVLKIDALNIYRRNQKLEEK